MKVSKLSREDVPAALELWCESRGTGGDPGPTRRDRDRMRRVLEQISASGKACCFLAREADAAAGFVTAAVIDHPVMDGPLGAVEELYVRPEFRGSGAGEGLLRHALDFLRERGAAVFRTHTCTKDSTAAGFWDRLGWERDVVTFSRYDGAPVNPAAG